MTELGTKLLEPYRGFVFRFQEWQQLSPDWDHDHCRSCSARFAARPEDWKDKVHIEGYVTLWPHADGSTVPLMGDGVKFIPAPKLAGFQLDWICPECFETVRDKLGFIVDQDHPQWKQAGL